MPQLLPTIEEFIATDIKRQGYWMVFNTSYNDAHAFKKYHETDEASGEGRYLEKEDTDQVARAEFLDFMKTHYPEIRLVEVFDLVGLGCMTWPYLGSIAIDMQPGDAVYAALSEKYGDPEQDPKFNNAVLWTMMLEDAIAAHEARCQRMEDF